jgi:serine/threonine protein kinase
MHTKRSGDQVGRYVIEAALGVGGMGEVYEARDTQLGRHVALKLVRHDVKQPSARRLLREAQAVASLDHPNAVVVYDVGEDQGEVFIAMELVRGRSLRDFVGDAGAPLGRKLRWLVDAARALGAAHRAGLVHRDVKPDNIMVRDDGAAKVLDFGVARHEALKPGEGDASGDDETKNPLGELVTVTAEGALIGTPRYLSPEQLRGDSIDGRADQFAWAVTAYELLSGAPPWAAQAPVALLSQILTSDPPPLSASVDALPEDVERVILRALSKRADDRFSSIDEAADALEPFAETPSSQLKGAPSRSIRAVVTEAMTGSASGTSDGHRSAESRTKPGRARHLVRRLAPLAGLAVIAGAVAFGTGARFRQVAGVGARAEATAPLAVTSLACGPAELRGSEASPELARAIGASACARLAVDVGVDFGSPSAPHRVDVEAALENDGATITLRVGGRKAEGRGATPIEAILTAVKEIAPELAPPPMTQAQIQAWGATDAASARRIERAWMRLVLDFAPDDQVAAKELLESDPGSPMTQYIAWNAQVGGLDGVSALRDKMLSLVDKLPPSRQKVIHAKFAGREKLSDGESLKLHRQAYAEAPDDLFVASAYSKEAIFSGTAASEEGYAVLDRLYERAPGGSVWPMMLALERAGYKSEIERTRTYAERLWALLPESRGWNASIRYLVKAGRIDEAREALRVSRELGMTNPYVAMGRAHVELAALQPKAAREIGTKLLAEPRPLLWTEGARVTIAAYLLEGRMSDAQAARSRDIERLRASGQEEAALYLMFPQMTERRWIGRGELAPSERAWIEENILRASGERDGWLMPIRAELALDRLATDRRGGRKAAEQALAAMEATAVSRGDESARDTALVWTVPLVRALRGDAEAVKRWRETYRAAFLARAENALDAGLALEAAGLRDDAEAAYRLALDPDLLRWQTMGVLAAHVKLAALLRSEKRDGEATFLERVIERLWGNAEPGVLEGARKLK